MSKHESVEKFNIRTLEIAGFSSAELALRLPFGNKNVPDLDAPVSAGYVKDTNFYYYMYSDNVNLLSKLVLRGDEHAKVLRGIIVWCEITAPRYWWQECDRYSVGACCLSSNSTMHQQGRGLEEDELIEMKENLPEGTMQTRVWTFSYQALRRIYFQRRNHRLPQWRVFCEWIKTLPLSEELITNERRNGHTDK